MVSARVAAAAGADPARLPMVPKRKDAASLLLRRAAWTARGESEVY